MPDQLRDASGMARYAREHGGLDFVLGVGDNFYPAGVKNVEDKRFAETFEEAYAEPELMVDWWHLAGNHDHRGNASAQVAYSARSQRWNMPALWYTTSHAFIDAATGDTIVTQLVVVDTTVLWGIEEHVNDGLDMIITPVPELQARADEQLAWLEATLENSTADYLWLAGHYPIYDPKSVDPRKRGVFLPLMSKYTVSGYLAGHCHTMQHFDTVSRVAGGEGFAFVVSGCGKECNNPAQPSNATAAWNAGCETAACEVVQSYRYSPNATGTRVNSSFVSMRVGAEATTISYVSDQGALMYTAKPVKRRRRTP